jgi:DMSO/TMAO reductase YedYZ heme-binding membrane subunit
MSSSLYQNSSPVDTDLDGLTDQGELMLFFTDPNNTDSDGDGYWDGTEVLYETNPLDANDPAQATTELPDQDIAWSWVLARVSGITSYLLLFVLMILGVGISSGYIFRLVGPIVAWRIHRATGITLMAFVFIHLVALFLDDFMNFSILDLFVPFYSEFSPTYMSLGIIGFYLLAIIVLSSIFMIVTKYKAWRFLHYLTFPVFVALFIHGVFLGSDTGSLAMQITYWVTGVLVAFSFAYRVVKAL